MLRRHGRYVYSPITERPVYDWPDGKRLAIYVALNIEAFPFGEGLGIDLAPRQASQQACIWAGVAGGLSLTGGQGANMANAQWEELGPYSVVYALSNGVANISTYAFCSFFTCVRATELGAAWRRSALSLLRGNTSTNT
jgi:hypothetical protein